MGSAEIINVFGKLAKNGNIVAFSTLILAGCDDTGQFNFGQSLRGNGASAKPQRAGNATKTTERNVEAPQVFSTTEDGLWDGRPSLGGVWVAHPDVKESERVIIRNATNGNFVVGALFRRARDLPGPRMQISSDETEALGVLASAPAKLNFTALRQEQVADAVPKIVDTVAAPFEVSEIALDPTTSTADAIDAAAPTTPTAATAPTKPPALRQPIPALRNHLSSLVFSQSKPMQPAPVNRCATQVLFHRSNKVNVAANSSGVSLLVPQPTNQNALLYSKKIKGEGFLMPTPTRTKPIFRSYPT
jgi:hypothetical protein